MFRAETPRQHDSPDKIRQVNSFQIPRGKRFPNHQMSFSRAFVPLWPFFFFTGLTGMLTSLGVSALVLFIIGFCKSVLMKVGNKFLAGLEMLMIGMVKLVLSLFSYSPLKTSALIGWGIGWMFDTFYAS